MTKEDRMDGRCIAWVGTHVRVETSDHDGAPDGLIVSLAAPASDPEVGVTLIEVSRAEAREIIQGLAALL